MPYVWRFVHAPITFALLIKPHVREAALCTLRSLRSLRYILYLGGYIPRCVDEDAANVFRVRRILVPAVYVYYIYSVHVCMCGNIDARRAPYTTRHVLEQILSAACVRAHYGHMAQFLA